MYKLQDISWPPFIYDEAEKELYYRGNGVIFRKPDSRFVRKKSFFDLFTYFNALSAEKWRTYTYARKFRLVVDIEGCFEIQLFGHYIENNVIRKEFLGAYLFEEKKRWKIVIPYPDDFKSMVVGFYIKARSNLQIFECFYAADLEEETHSEPYIAIAMTTFKKESFVRANVKKIRNEILETEEYGEHFCWNIIDNGRTLPEDRTGKIKVFHNKNVGGAGGFARGMMESLRQEKKPSHILLMDDDVRISCESLKRLYKLLDILRPEYRDYFVSGAMLNMEEPNIQHENTAKIDEKGCIRPEKTGMNLTLWDNVLRNEVIPTDNIQRHAAWWFCCIPTTIANINNLPLPVFVRGDDVEYSLRNHAKFITMNGISIWHQGFAAKSNPAMEFYQSRRNEFIAYVSKEEGRDIEPFEMLEGLFWQEMYKFNYVAARFMIEAVEDYMKGPEWFSSRDLYAILTEKRKQEQTPRDITEGIRNRINYTTLYQYESAPRLMKFVYDYTYNGQARIPEFLLKKKEGIIPRDGYFPKKQLLTSVNYAIDSIHDTYIELKKDRKQFAELKKRFRKLKQNYFERKEEVKEQYRKALPRLTSEDFWNQYLKQQ